MKKTLKLLLIGALSFSFIANANAAKYSSDDSFYIQRDTYGATGNYCKGCYYNNRLSNDTNIVQYHIEHTANGKEYSAYCLDVQNTAPIGSALKVNKVITSGSPSFDSYYAGLVAIGSKGYNKVNNTSGYGVSGFNFYAATTMAVRMYAIANNDGTATSSHGSDPASAGNTYNYTMSNTAAKWCYENKDIANKALGLKCDSAACFWKSFGLSGADSIGGRTKYSSDTVIKSGDNANVLKAAKDMFVYGLKAAANFKDTKTIGTSSVSLSKDKTLATKKADTTTHFVRKDYYTLKVSNFTTNDNINSLSVSCTNCSSIPGSPSIAITGYSLDNGKTFKNGIPSNDVLKKLTGNANVILEISGTIKKNSGYDCTDIKYDINYNFKSASANYEIYIIGDGSNLNQRFYAIITDSDANPNGNPQTETRTMDYCATEKCAYYDPKDFEQMDEEEFTRYTSDCCTDLNNYCEDKNNKDRDYYCDLYSEYCGACDTEIVIPQVCTYIEGVEGEDIAEDMTGYVKSAVDEDGKSNIKACLLMRKKDEAGNSYKAMENSYCKVYCKEDFTFNLPTAVSVNSGTYFQLDATVTGTKTCYTSEIDTQKFNDDIDLLTEGTKAYDEKVAEYNACVNMEVDYDCFNPEIEYEYEEIYNDQLGENNKFELVGGKAETIKDETTYCNSDINDDYSCKDGSTKGVLNIDGVAFTTTKYVKSTITKTGVYKTPSVFYTQHPSGTVTTDKDAENATLINGLPVSVKTDKGRHKFTLNITNLGELYDPQDKKECETINGKQCCNGRIVGDKNSIINKQVQNGLKTTSEYMCYYDVNCPECEFECEGPLCDLEICDGDECTATCLGNGCAYDTGAGLSYAYRTITLGNLNPNSRSLGYNWNPENSVKAKETIAEIEETGEEVYEEAEYSFTLTPALITAIKEYNKTQLNNGGYADQSLTCSNDKYGNENVNCESDFITKLVKGEIGTRNNKVTVPSNEDKFTSWLDSDYCNGTCTITKGSGIGPSWK